METISTGRLPRRLIDGSGMESRLDKSRFHPCHLPLSLSSTLPPANISGPPLLRRLSVFFRFRVFPFTLLRPNRSRRSSDMSAGTEPRRGEGIPLEMPSVTRELPLLLVPVWAPLLLLLLLLTGKFSRWSKRQSFRVFRKIVRIFHRREWRKKLLRYLPAGTNAFSNRLLRAASWGRLARLGNGTFSPRGPRADRKDPPDERRERNIDYWVDRII